ncbi:type II and III secretion system protein family protein [Prosthecomicrobium sp. N25]|uniref:type II and III secretion system protein family protein n=1 Tax=Prosthecomicrobium sp. N25 TaxID=3129254 RepID=UPI003076F3EC
MTRSVKVLAALAVASGLLAGVGGTAFGPGEAAAQTLARKVSTANRLSNLRVSQGKSETLEIERAFTDITVGDPEIADVVPLTDRTLYVLGKKIGTTNISVFDRAKNLVGVIEVEVSHDVGRLGAELKTQVPTANIRVGTANGKVILSGTVRDAASLDKALTIARQFAPDVINSLSVGTSQQVMLEVRFVEVNRSAERQLGVRWSALQGKSGAAFLPNRGGPPESDRTWTYRGAATTTTLPFGGVFGSLVANGVNVDFLIRALEDQNVARRLAEPNLIALSGQPANFFAGGKIPIVIPGTFGSPGTVEYKEYGVKLAFTPTVLDTGLVNLKIAPSVSELDYANAVPLNGGLQPAITERSTETMVELRDGQSFAVAGLLQTRSETLLEQLPWVGSLPVLGALFRSTSFQKNETELVITVTPRLVRPMSPGVTAKTPFDSRVVGNDVDVFAAGRAELTPPEARAADFGGVRPVFSGHIIDVPADEKRRIHAKR